MITRVGVVGCGLMGSGIAEVCARAGMDVIAYEVNGPAAAAGTRRIEASLARAVKSGKLAEAAKEETMGRIRLTTDLGALGDRELVMEAIVEDEAAKVDVFARLDKIVASPDALLASNTSSIPIMKLAMATDRPAQVVGIHFFNPVPVLHLVEVVNSLLTSEPTTTRCSFPTSCRPSGCSSRASLPPRTSTTGWSRDAPTRWALWRSPT